MDRGRLPLSRLYPPPPHPLVFQVPSFSSARFAHAKFSSVSLPPFPQFFSPLPPPPLNFQPPLTLSTSSCLMNKLFCFSVAKAMNCFRFFFFFLFFFCMFIFFFNCTKLCKDKSSRYVGMRRRHPAGLNIAGVNKRLMQICNSLLHVTVFPYFGEDGRAIRRRLSSFGSYKTTYRKDVYQSPYEDRHYSVLLFAFSNTCPIDRKAVVRSGVINIYTSLLLLDTPT